MCGISGILSKNVTSIPEFLQRSIVLLEHRGPDQQAFWHENEVGLGHARLSILDLSPAGAQPMLSADGRYVLAFNGEIYNHLELRKKHLAQHQFRGHSDSETILELFALKGPSVFAEMVGMWAILIWDKTEKCLYLSRDRFGQKPLYVRKFADGWSFASEMKVLMQEGEWQTPDYTSLVEYVATSNYGHLGERTFFNDIFHFPAASWCRIKVTDSNLQPQSYWSLPVISEKDRVPVGPDQLKTIRELLIDSVLSQTLSDVPIGITLSGGIDSSVIAGILAQNYQLPLQVFTATSPGHKWDEGGYVNAVMSHWNRKNWELNIADLSSFDFKNDLNTILWHQEEPFGDPSILAHAELMRMASEKGIKVILGGQGSDELFLGYDHALTPILIQQAKLHEWSLLKENIKGIGWTKMQVARLALTGLLPSLELQLRRASRKARRKHLPEEWLKNVDDKAVRFYRQDQVDNVRQESIYGIHLPHLLHYDDRNAMAYGVEGRTPFLDHRLWEFVSTLKTDAFLKNGKRKHILREACSQFLPPMVQQRLDKIGFFTPLDSWLQSNIGTVEQEIHQFIPAPIEEKIEKHLLDYRAARRSVEGGQLLWRLYVTALWSKQFLKTPFHSSIKDRE